MAMYDADVVAYSVDKLSRFERVLERSKGVIKVWMRWNISLIYEQRKSETEWVDVTEANL